LHQLEEETLKLVKEMVGRISTDRNLIVNPPHEGLIGHSKECILCESKALQCKDNRTYLWNLGLLLSSSSLERNLLFPEGDMDTIFCRDSFFSLHVILFMDKKGVGGWDLNKGFIGSLMGFDLMSGTKLFDDTGIQHLKPSKKHKQWKCIKEARPY
jgi:hypothetical protein